MKQVIVVNQALDLPAGKLAAQVAHASVSAFVLADPEAQKRWLECGMPKIVLAVASAEALRELQSLADAGSVPASLVEDAGKTLLPAGTITCIGIGPAETQNIDRLTGRLALL
ncbi:MAG: aminoacyl-tRNA hydrolase [Hyphomicrobiales bacterium]|nr:aminoacyl-tRNA hydrolase [Hyphomicrobiales bacterium]